MSQAISEKTEAAWGRLVESQEALSHALKELKSEVGDRVSIVRAKLSSPQGNDRAAALFAVRYMDVPEQQELFPELVHLSRCAHGPFYAAWQLILSLPRQWVLSHIEPEVEAILRNEEEDDYWMFLQLYEQLDRDLTLKLARRAASHTNPEIRELGEDSLERLSQPMVSGDGRCLAD